MLCMLFVLIFIVFMYYFTCISFAIRPSGRKSAIKLIETDWLTLVALKMWTFIPQIAKIGNFWCFAPKGYIPLSDAIFTKFGMGRVSQGTTPPSWLYKRGPKPAQDVKIWTFGINRASTKKSIFWRLGRAHVSKATMVKFGTSGRTWNTFHYA